MRSNNSEMAASSPLAWGVVALLHAAYALAFIDRLVIGLLAPSIGASLHLTDLQLGLLMGPAFAITYILAGLALGALVDRARRLLIVGAAILVWSAATMLCGLAGRFEALFAARVAVGIGEAAIAPAALSLIGDLFSRRRRPLAVGVFGFGVTLGASAAFIIGGLLMTTFRQAGVAEPWRLVFLSVGAPGLVLGIIALCLREPRRRSTEAPSIRAAIAFARANGRLIAGHFLGFGVFATLSTAFGAWVPSILMREHGMSVGEVGGVFGLIVLAGGLGGVVLGGGIAAALVRRGRADATLLTVLIGIGGGAIPAVLASLVADPLACLGLFAAAFLFTSLASGASLAALQDATPARLRGQIGALYYLILNLFGLTLGPLLAPLAARVWPGGGQLGLALSLVSALVSAIGFMAILFARGAFVRAVGERAMETA